MNDQIILTDPTLNGTKDPVRKKSKLEDSRLNIQMQILERLDNISIIDHEIQVLDSCKFASPPSEGTGERP